MKKKIAKVKDDRGAIIVEATLSLPVFIFAIFLVLSIVNICYVQSKVGVALAAATKEVSQYSYVYYAISGDEFQKKLTEKGEDVDSMFANIGTLIGNGVSTATDINNGDFDALLADAENTGKTAIELESQFETVLDDPLSFMLGLASTQINDKAESVKSTLGEYMIRMFMKKNLVQDSGGNPDRFLRKMHVVGGMKGLHFSGVSLMALGSTDEITVSVTY